MEVDAGRLEGSLSCSGSKSLEVVGNTSKAVQKSLRAAERRTWSGTKDSEIIAVRRVVKLWGGGYEGVQGVVVSRRGLVKSR